jgi:hypothetical protein
LHRPHEVVYEIAVPQKHSLSLTMAMSAPGEGSGCVFARTLISKTRVVRVYFFFYPGNPAFTNFYRGGELAFFH